MQFSRKKWAGLGKLSLGSLLAGLVLLLNALAASPQLHELFHADTSKAGHLCAVTMFAHGQVDSATVEVAAITPSFSDETIPLVEFSVFAPAIENLPPGRAPPFSSCNS